MTRSSVRETGIELGGRGGFTLLEVVVAMTLLAIILAEVSGTLWGGIRASEKGRARSDTLERYRTVTALVRDQLASALPLKSERDGEQVIQFFGDSDRLEFASTVSMWGRQGLVLVRYGSRTDDGDQVSLVSEETDATGVRLGDDGTMLMEGLSAVTFRYLSRASAVDTAAPEWVERWEDTAQLPRAVSITLTAGESETVIVIPIGAGKVAA